MKRNPTILKAIWTGVFLLFPLAICSQTFKASHLQKAYEKLGISAQDSKGLTIRKAQDGTIEHIGIPLFSTEMRTLLPSPIYDYLEYALLDHKYHINENTLQQQKIRFRNGSWGDLEKITPADDCTIDNQDDKWYIVRWSFQAQEILSVAIPIDYELLSNSSRKEMEQNFSRDLKCYKSVSPQETSSTHELNTSSPKETLSAILMTSDHASVKATLNIELLYAGFRKESVSVTLSQWMEFCKSEGCTPYYIYEGATDDQASAILLMYNRSEGYAHLLYLHAAISQLDAKEQDYQGKVYMFIPTNNIEDLFAKSTGPSAPKTYE